MNRMLSVALLMLGIVSLALVAWQMRRGIPVQAASVVRGDVSQYVDERGTTRLAQVYKITMPYAARINKITLREGEHVKAAQVVAHVAEADLENELAETTAVVQRLTASIRENDDISVELSVKQQAALFVASMAATVKAAEARVTAGKKRLDFAETFLARTQRLAQTQAATQEDLDLADLRHVESQSEYRQDNLVWQATKAIAAATQLLPQMVGQYITRKQLTHAVLAEQKSEAEARLRQMRIRQLRGRMTSPVDGVVLKRAVRNEQFLPAGAELLEIGDLNDLEIETDILSQDVIRIRQGDRAEVYGPAIGQPLGQGVEANVRSIRPAGFTKISSLGVEQQRVKVILQMESALIRNLVEEQDMGVGYRVRVRIFTDQNHDVLTIPRTALFRGANGDWHVFVVRDGKATLQAVEVGLLNDDVAEVTQGVAEGETIVLAPESSLEHGVRVQAMLR